MKPNRSILPVLIFLAAETAHPSTVMVTSTADSGPGTLRAALAEVANGDTIDATGVSGTISLSSGELLVRNSVAIVGPGPTTLAVNGNEISRVFHIGSNTVVSIFGLNVTNGFLPSTFPYMFGGGIYNDHAVLTLSNCFVNGNSTSCGGGGIANDGGTLTLVDSALNGNFSGGGGAIYNLGIYTGAPNNTATASLINCRLTHNLSSAIYNLGATLTLLHSTLTSNGNFFTGGAIGNVNGTVTVTDSVLSNNLASTGGAIYNFNLSAGTSTVYIVNSTITGNSGSGGGGILNQNNSSTGSASMSIAGSTVSGNSSAGDGGGGIASKGATLMITKSTISGNTATGPIGGGGVFSSAGILTIDSSTLSGNSAASGAGIENFVGTLTVGNSTISSNVASGFQGGGGIINYGILTVVCSTFSGNSAATGGCINNEGGYGPTTLEIGSTILNAGASGGTIVTNNSGSVHSLGYNLCSDGGGGFLTGSNDLINTDPMLGPLQDNGGPTRTHALLAGSPAIDQGFNFSGSAADQRGTGFVRTYDDPSIPNPPGGDGTDIGAFEVQPAPNLPPVAKCHDVTALADDTCTADVSVDDGSYDPDGDAITLTQTPPGPYPVGTNSVTLTAVDSHGASNSCTSLVIVQDTTPPQITCPTNFTTDATSDQGAVVTFAPVATDTCSGPPTVVCVPPSGSFFPIGTTSVVCTATDLSGNSATCEFQITVLGPHEMLERLLAVVNSLWTRPQPLTATLNAALASIDRNNLTSAINQLQAFQKKVHAQVMPSDPALAATLIQAAQDIINVLNTTPH